MKTYLNLVGFGITLTLVNETGLIPNKDGAEFEAPRATLTEIPSAFRDFLK